MSGRYLVYIFFLPSGVPCYVGKGTTRRIRQHYIDANNGSHCNHKLAQALRDSPDMPIIVMREGLTERAALECERALIAAVGREEHGGTLFNLTDGGDGSKGYYFTKDVRARMSAAKLGKEPWIKGRRHSADAIEKMRASHSGHRHSDETRAKMSAAKKGISTRGRKHSPEAIARKMPQLLSLAEAKRGKPRSEETKAKLRAAALRQHERRRALQAIGA